MAAMEALCSNEILNLILYDNNNYSPSPNSIATSPNFLLDEYNLIAPTNSSLHESSENSAAQGRKKRRRRSSKVCNNKEEAESQRMTHIAVERNRRKLMNQHLTVLRSLMPESYVERGDQASIVGGAIRFVKELEHLLQTLEAKKIEQSKQANEVKKASTPFSQFFAFPQYSSLFNTQMLPNKYSSCKTSSNIGGVGDAEIEVTLVESHANIRALCQTRPRQLSKLLSGFHSIYLTLLHLNVTTLDPLVLYSISAKVEEGCQLKSADDIAMAVHQIIRMIEEDANLSFT